MNAITTTAPLTTELLDEIQGRADYACPCDDIECRAMLDQVRHEDVPALIAEIKRLRAQPREDKRGRYLDSEGIGAGADGSQLITWGGNIDQITVRPSPHGGKVFLALGMLKLDAYESPETCPQVRVTLTDGHARELAAGIYESLGGTPGGAS